MPWIELNIDATAEAVDWVSTLLATTDYVKDINITKSANVESSWAFAIRLYLPYDVNATAHLEEISNLLSPLQRIGLIAALQMTVVEEKPFPASESPLVPAIGRFVILPPEAPQSTKTAKVAIRLKRSRAFGSGLHPTTVVSLRLLERYALPGMNVLDLGAGSGILSVAMAKLGAQVLALDNDPIAVQASQDAVELNSVEQQVNVMSGSLGQGSSLGHWMGGNISDTVPMLNVTATFDLIAANLLGRAHVTLAHDFHRALRQTESNPGILITAGYNTDYEKEVNTALIQAGFKAVDYERHQDWVALAHVLD